MQIEMETLKAKHTWDLVKPPPGVNIMDLMWIYDIKWDGEGNWIKDKARVVGKGYTQQLGVDYNETWAGVTRLESVQMTAAIAAKHDLKLWRINFVGAYLNSLTKEDIYMRQPEGFIKPCYEDHVCKLVHTIYGTMQGGHDWYETLSGTYDKLGYQTSRADPCVCIKKEDGNYTITDTYTDDIFGASNSDGEAKRRKDECQNSEGRSCGVTCCRKPQGTRRGFNLCVAPLYGNWSVLEFGGPEWCGNYLEMRRKFKRNRIGVLVDYKLRTTTVNYRFIYGKGTGMYRDVAKRNQSEYSNLIKSKACQS